MLKPLACLVVLGLTAAHSAELQIDVPGIVAPFGSRTVPFSITIQNSGADAVQMHSVEADCDCVVLVAPAQELLPSTSVRVRGEFNPPAPTGDFVRNVTVVSSKEGKPARTSAQLKISVKGLAEVAPRVLAWKIGEEPRKKRIEIRFLDSDAFLKTVSADEDLFTLTENTDNGATIVEAIPKTTKVGDRGKQTTVHIICGRRGINTTSEYRAYLYIE